MLKHCTFVLSRSQLMLILSQVRISFMLHFLSTSIMLAVDEFICLYDSEHQNIKFNEYAIENDVFYVLTHCYHILLCLYGH